MFTFSGPALDNHLTFLLNQSNSHMLAANSDATAFGTVRSLLSAAAGAQAAMAGFAGADDLVLHLRMLEEATTANDLVTAQQMIFSRAFGQLNAMER